LNKNGLGSNVKYTPLVNADVIYRGNLDENGKRFPSTHDHPMMKRITEKCLSEVSFMSDDQPPSPRLASNLDLIMLQ
jgi:hypothetical protein